MNNLSQNRNLAKPTKFRLTIDSQRFANVEFHCFSAPLPLISVAEASSPFRSEGAAVPGERIDYSPMDIRFMIDEELRNYQEIHQWMLDNARGDHLYNDLLLAILDSNNKVTREIRFVAAFPIALEGLEFNFQTSDVEYLSASATFRYTRFEFVR